MLQTPAHGQAGPEATSSKKLRKKGQPGITERLARRIVPPFFTSSILFSNARMLTIDAAVLISYQLLDITCDPGLCLQKRGGRSVKQFRWVLIIFLLGAIFCASAIPAVDNPDTAFDESDSPANLALPASPVVKIVLPAATPVLLPEGLPQIGDVSFPVHTLETATKQHSHKSLLALLCTFLI
jgi:hypothetical protein